jgi:hypothetical protein
VNGKIVSAEIKLTIHNAEYSQLLSRSCMGREKDSLMILNNDGDVKFFVVYNSVRNLKKIRENAEKLTFKVIFDGDTGTGLVPLFGAFICKKEIIKQLDIIFNRAINEGNLDKNGNYTRNGSRVTVYVDPDDIIYFDDEWDADCFKIKDERER